MTVDTHEMLGALVARLEAGCIELRPIHRSEGARRSEFFPVEQHGRAATSAIQLGESCDVYFSAIPRVREGRGAADVGPAPAAWADLDTPDAHAALAAFTAFKLPPSILIASGTADNRHAYWLLDEPQPAEAIVQLNRDLARMLGADERATDAARVLRLPGTLNHKTMPPTVVRLLSLTERRYGFDELREVVPKSRSTARGVRATERTSTEVSAPVTRVLDVLKGSRRVSAGWSALCPAHDDTSPSLSIQQGDDGRCLLKCHAGCSTEDIMTTLGLQMADLFEAPHGGPATQSEATRLVGIALDSGIELVHDDQNAAYGCVEVDEHCETMPVLSREFEDWLQYLFFTQRRKVPSSQVIHDAVATLRGMARFEGEQVPVPVRVGGDTRRVLIDLGDAAWRAVEVTAAGWQVIDRPNLRFRRPATSLPLPEPIEAARWTSCGPSST